MIHGASTSLLHYIYIIIVIISYYMILLQKSDRVTTIDFNRMPSIIQATTGSSIPLIPMYMYKALA